MPFDVSTAAVPTLTSTLDELGIIAVSAGILREHKIAERKKHPGSWWFKHTQLATSLIFGIFCFSFIVTCASVVFTLGSMITAHLTLALISASIALLIGGCFVTLAISIVSGRLRHGVWIKGPARWVEYTLGNPSLWRCLLVGVPESIATTALQIIARLPHVELVIGELRQSKTLLDPYVVLRYQAEEVVIGIWDGGTIIHEAQRTTD